jgi:hypothetical protein
MQKVRAIRTIQERNGCNAGHSISEQGDWFPWFPTPGRPQPHPRHGAAHVFLRYNVISATQLHEVVGGTWIKGDKVAQQRKNDAKRSRPSP